MSGGELAVGDAVAVACPACGDGTPARHEVVKPGVPATVRCRQCEHVHKARIEGPPTLTLRVIVSMDAESVKTTAEVPKSERLAVGEEFVVDTPEGLLGVRITSLERADRRTEAAPATEIETIWTRAVDNVLVNTTIHPADGDREATRSEKLPLPGDESVTVGEDLTVAEEILTIEGIRLREDARGYPTDQLDRAGDTAPAKDIDRLYAREAGGGAWRSPWDDV